MLKERKINGLEDCDSTINVCLRFNDIFDALNRKIPFQGVNLESNDYTIRMSSNIPQYLFSVFCIKCCFGGRN